MLRFLLSLNIVWAVSCAVLYLIVGINPSTFWLFSIVSLLVPVFFLVNILLFLFWIIFHWRYAWIPLLTLLFGWNAFFLMVSFGEENKAKKCSREPVQIMSYNVYGLKQLKDSSEARMQMKKSAFTSFIRQHEPDILCVQEDNFFADDVINKTGLYPYFHYQIQHGAAIYSKFPIINKGRVDFGTRTNSCLWVDLLVKGREMRVYSVHLKSNQITKDLGTMTDEKSENTDERLSTLKRILRKYRNSAIVRAKQAASVLEDARQSGKPCIIAGDLNDTPFSYSYKLLAKDRKDSFLECGSGLGATYVAALPGLRIDLILADSKSFGFCSHKVLHTSYSDHYPVLAKFYMQ